ncbi:hypothetical protein ACH5RR_003546 [Cinchona calisaya]|uniref:Uncharacterized protein n=1 Tax=Cinchona calisaya TaxID=153742 RepID=A0ABD3AVB6_9GENT
MIEAIAESGSEREEEELVTDTIDIEVAGSVSNTIGSPETTTEIPPKVDKDPLDQATMEVGEIDTYQALDDDENEESIMTDFSESSSKVHDNVKPTAAEIDEVSEAAITDLDNISANTIVKIGASGQSGTSVTNDKEKKKQVSPINRISTTTINLHEWNKDRASIRQVALYSSLSRGRGRTP